jgi:hypothetical protein
MKTFDIKAFGIKAFGMIILFTTLFFITACGRGKNNPNENNNENNPVIPQQTPAFVSPLEITRLVPEVRSDVAGIPIVWGYNPRMYESAGFYRRMDELQRIAVSTAERAFTLYGIIVEPDKDALLSPVAVHRILSEHFDVKLSGILVTDEMINSGNVPDIFLANPHVIQPTGIVRTIPEDMIRRYAPNYAALLDLHNGWEVSRAANGEQLALNTFDYYHNDASLFSLYRLEWIERFDFPFPGGNPIQQIADNVYFTPEMYTTDEFLQLMNLFSFEEPNPHERPRGVNAAAADRTWSMVISLFFTYDSTFSTVAPILNMFGVNMGIMEENGVAMPFFASQAFREALGFFENLNADVIFSRGTHSADLFINHYLRIGWATVDLQDLYRTVNETLRRDPDRRILITPAVRSLQSQSPFNADGNAWVISNDVSNFTLSRILNMFDAMSFDPEIFSLVTYGFHEESYFYDEEASKRFTIVAEHDGTLPTAVVLGKARFAWEGEPYNSVADFRRRNPHFDLLEGAFFTGIVDGTTWPRHFFGSFDEIERFAKSDEGRRLNLLPHRVDINNEFTVRRALLDSLYWQDLMLGEYDIFWQITTEWGYVFDYMKHIIGQQKDVSSTWDEYIQGLNNRGLQEYIDLFSQFSQR